MAKRRRDFKVLNALSYTRTWMAGHSGDVAVWVDARGWLSAEGERQRATGCKQKLADVNRQNAEERFKAARALISLWQLKLPAWSIRDIPRLSSRRLICMAYFRTKLSVALDGNRSARDYRNYSRFALVWGGACSWIFQFSIAQRRVDVQSKSDEIRE